MIRYLKHPEVDINKWNQCIDNSFNGLIYAHSWYLSMVNENWEALVENDYERVFPLTTRRKLGMDYLFQPRFTQQLGIFSKSLLTEEVVQNFLDAIPSKFKHIDINLNTFNKLDQAARSTTLWLNHELDMISPYEKLASAYSSNLKRNLKKATASKISVIKNIKPDYIINIFKSNKGKQLIALHDNDYQLLKRLVYLMIYKGVAETVGAFDENNELCAGAIFVYSKKKVIFYFSATNELAKASAAMPLLIDTFIRENSGKHLTLDFEGSNDPNLARFYKGFGAKELYYPHYEKNSLNPVLRAGFEMFRNLKNISNRLHGNFLRRIK